MPTLSCLSGFSERNFGQVGTARLFLSHSDCRVIMNNEQREREYERVRERGRERERGSSHFHSKSLCCLTQGEVGCLVFVFAVAIPATVSSLCVLSRSRRLSFLVLVWFGRIGF